MSLISLIENLKNNGYVIENDEYKSTDCSFLIHRAKKGKIFSKKLLIIEIDDFQNVNFNNIVSAVKMINKKNDSCIALCHCDEISNEMKSKTLYMTDNGDGVCLIYFVYNDKNKKYTYDLDFSYYQSKIVKNAILELVA